MRYSITLVVEKEREGTFVGMRVAIIKCCRGIGLFHLILIKCEMSLFETKTRKKKKKTTCMTYLPGCGRQSEINQIFLRYFWQVLKQERVAVIDN